VHTALARAAESTQDALLPPSPVQAIDPMLSVARLEKARDVASITIEEVDEGFDFPEAEATEIRGADGLAAPRACVLQEQKEYRGADYSREEVLRRIRSKQHLKRAGLNGLDLSGIDFEGVDLTRAELDGAKLDGAKLDGAILQNASLRHASLKGAHLDRARLDKADLTDADLESASLNGASLNRACLARANFSSASLVDADMTRVDATQAGFLGASLLRAKLNGAQLSGADLSGSDARHANFAEAELSGAILNGVRLTHATLSLVKTSPATHARFIVVAEEGAHLQRLEGAQAMAFLRGQPLRPAAATRYFGKGDLLRDALLDFGAGSRIHIESRFENCSIVLGDGAELVIGEAGVLRDCQIAGYGELTVHGCFFERQSPGISGARSLVVSSRGAVSAVVQQAEQPTAFAFEPGCRLRIKISQATRAQAAE
jgi:uncharacterized protein YjbI with pentapeptide repeats